ncbi:LysR family transcriptional regulator [Longispora fulva]|uniref:DNA-binding transcriptional LysR family regulator n=1 Tax=Longispora fulva TaxID=619741 RepID=A0A8J7G737_9ACTN|nr:LysR family transcriptional regulator [Longispora fulva]MBG6134898.1 DNA-binding transcriptional LysR family regulator [Longispora fulva]GIG56870.1 LysR family transcriptional regulator [Longispora fulva]
MELDLRHLRVLCQVAESGSVSRAAVALGVSQPALTAKLGRIETALGGRLFERGPQGVEPTALGHFVLRRARGILSEMGELVAGGRTENVGALRFGALRSSFIGALLGRLQQDLPARDVSTRVDSSGVVVAQLLANDLVDVVVIGAHKSHLPPCPPGVVERVIVDPEPLYVVLAAEHRMACLDMIDLADLAKDWWIGPPGGDDGSLAVFREACERAGFTPRLRYTNLEATDAEQLVATGQGAMMCVPTYPGRREVVVLPLAGQPILGHRVLRWRPEAVSAAEVDVIHQATIDVYVDAVRRNTATLPWWDRHPETHPVLWAPVPAGV